MVYVFGVSACEQFSHVVCQWPILKLSSTVAVEQRPDRPVRVQNKLCGPFLVIFSHRTRITVLNDGFVCMLKRMTEGAVTDIVQQSGEKCDLLAIQVRFAILRQEFALNNFDELPCGMKNTDAVSEPSVCSTWKNKL